MRTTFYSSLGMLVLAGSLAACSADQRVRQVPAAAEPPTVPSLPAPTATPPAGASQAAGPPAIASHRAAPPQAPTTRWGRRPSRAVSLPVVAVKGERAERAEEHSGDPRLMMPSSTAANSDLPTFCAQAAPQGQAFEVRPGRDTVLVAQQGTRLVIPGQAFDVPTGSGPVTLTMREFYNTADIVLAGLGTRTGADMLETGGTLHLYAAANGQTVHLRPGMQVLVQLPTQQQLPGMRLYEGESADPDHAPNWQLPDTGTPAVGGGVPTDPAALDEWVKLHPPKNPRWPYFEKNSAHAESVPIIPREARP